ncbi:HAD-IIB family hydrolase [Streptomyces sp. NPDC047706]|uniref:HAD-IIB family hydrolase n=1 Tax=Streptomyces sp. NPDC047706 TaxID=3365486 RepID=UPI00371F231F
MPPSTDLGVLPMPRTVRTVVFSDFDETYLAHAGTPGHVRSRRRLESYLAEAAQRHGMLFGWVTGSSLGSVLRKTETHGMHTLPHFLACSLGTELYTVRDGALHPDPGWLRGLPGSAHIAVLAEQVVRELRLRGMPLVPQHNRPPGTRVISHYYYAQDAERDARNLALVRQVAEALSLGVSVSRCSPAAGDPEDCYDVDFLPPACGKRRIVDYVCRVHGVDPAGAYAFGDSGNDLEMLAAVGAGTLVGNCTEEARSRYPRVSAWSHTDAIFYELRKELGVCESE